jgi:monofunctional biosynthetic peptidoglycan transglycosylase
LAALAKARKTRKSDKAAAPSGLGRRLRRWALRGLAGFVVALVAVVLIYAVVNPPTTPYMLAERYRLGSVAHEWVDIEDIAPVMQRSVVAAEDANFCLHYGFDMGAIREAIATGANRGASTITQQVAKNVYLWQGRSWLRKALEASLTPVIELFWTKRRILEVYLNVAEFGDGVFGVAAASQKAFGVAPGKLTADQAARLAVVLPDPKDRSAKNPSRYLRHRASVVRDGAATIEADGRAACFSNAD